jgi:hypothetical protein
MFFFARLIVYANCLRKNTKPAGGAAVVAGRVEFVKSIMMDERRKRKVRRVFCRTVARNFVKQDRRLGR